MRVPFLDLGAQHAPVRDDILASWAEIYDSTRFVGSREVERFERSFAEAHGASECVAMRSGTDALHLALRALGVGPGDEVVVPANTFIATAEAVSHTGATPKLVELLHRSRLKSTTPTKGRIPIQNRHRPKRRASWLIAPASPSSKPPRASSADFQRRSAAIPSATDTRTSATGRNMGG